MKREDIELYLDRANRVLCGRPWYGTEKATLLFYCKDRWEVPETDLVAWLTDVKDNCDGLRAMGLGGWFT